METSAKQRGAGVNANQPNWKPNKAWAQAIYTWELREALWKELESRVLVVCVCVCVCV